jgi:antitoxin MazE
MPHVVDTAINQWGNGLALRLTRSVAKAAGIAEGSPVRVTAEPGRLIVEVVTRRMTLQERLERFDPARDGGEAMAFEPVGREIP